MANSNVVAVALLLLLQTSFTFTSGLELTQGCSYLSDSSDSRLQSTSYLPSKIQCAVYCQQNRQNVFNFQDGVCKTGNNLINDTTTPTTTGSASPTTATALTTTPSVTYFVSLSSAKGTTLNITKCTSDNRDIYFVHSPTSTNGATNGFCNSLSPRTSPVKLQTQIKDLLLQSMLKYLYPKLTEISEFWIDGSAAGKAWKWGSNEALTYNNWCSVEPVATANTCATLKESNGVLCWGYDTCNIAKPFICE